MTNDVDPRDSSKSSRLVQWLGIVADLAVLGGILFLGIELRQNASIVRAQTRAAISDESSDHLLRGAESPELMELINTAEAGEPLTAPEAARVNVFYQSRLRRWENIHYQYRHGLYSESEFAGQRAAWVRALRSVPFKEHFMSHRSEYAEELATELDDILRRLEESG
jgi:hypothetical protein